MKVKFNKFERVASAFVGIAIVGAVLLILMTAIKKGWFSAKVSFATSFHSVSGVFPGTSVHIAGLKAGSVEDIDLKDDNSVVVHFTVLEKFVSRIRQDSRVTVTRPFIIGDKVLDISVGSKDSPVVVAGSSLESAESMDIMDIFSGRKLGPYFDMLGKLFENLRLVAEAFLDPERSKAFIRAFDEIQPLLSNLNRMSKSVITLGDQMVDQDRLRKLMKSVLTATQEVNGLLPDLRKSSPHLASNVAQMIDNLNYLTSEMRRPEAMPELIRAIGNLGTLSEEFKKLIPTISAVSGDLPRASLRALEALDEVVVMLKAMQKSFVFRGSVEEVREEEKKQGEVRNLEPVKVEREPAKAGGR